MTESCCREGCYMFAPGTSERAKCEAAPRCRRELPPVKAPGAAVLALLLATIGTLPPKAT